MGCMPGFLPRRKYVSTECVQRILPPLYAREPSHCKGLRAFEYVSTVHIIKNIKYKIYHYKFAIYHALNILTHTTRAAAPTARCTTGLGVGAHCICARAGACEMMAATGGYLIRPYRVRWKFRLHSASPSGLIPAGGANNGRPSRPPVQTLFRTQGDEHQGVLGHHVALHVVGGADGVDGGTAALGQLPQLCARQN